MEKVKIIKKIPTDIVAKDWFIFLERKLPFFLMPTLFKPYFDLFFREIGICFKNQIYIFQKDTIYYLRSKNEFDKIIDYLAKFILDKNNSERIENWIQSGRMVNTKADTEIQYYKNISENEIKDPIRYRTFLDYFYKLVFFSTVVPYFVLHAADHVLHTSKDTWEMDHAQKLIKMFEPIRGDSRYPQVIEGVVSRYFEYLAKITSSSISEVGFLLPDEIEEILKNNLSIKDIENFQLREYCLVGIYPNGDMFIDYFKSDISGLLPKVKFTDGDIRGIIAYKGRVSGIVRIVNTAAEMEKVNKGDIIVSINTNPSLMPAIKNAAGIVTDDGGITCHAAIISRELKIPCVVGTKIATKVLKDGDLVEVDAEKGIVRIFK